MNNRKTILFDFDGTIADTMLIGINILNQLAEKHNFNKIGEDQLSTIRDKKAQEVMKIIDLPRYKLPLVARKLKKRMHQQIVNSEPFNGIKEVINQLHAAGHRLGIVTSNSDKNINLFLGSHSLKGYFEIIHSGISLFGKSKCIEKMIKKHTLIREEMTFIGDETRDIEAAKKCNINIISVSWGYNSKKALSRLNPNHIVETPEELICLLEENKF
ncbi:MAG: HAD-IA family hydrolase [Bacteroidota bacterium]